LIIAAASGSIFYKEMSWKGVLSSETSAVTTDDHSSKRSFAVSGSMRRSREYEVREKGCVTTLWNAVSGVSPVG
jgi:hypothetical protein